MHVINTGVFLLKLTSVRCWTLLTYNVHTHKSYLPASNLITACIHLYATRHLLRNSLFCLAGSQSGPEVRSEHRFVTALDHTYYIEQSISLLGVCKFVLNSSSASTLRLQVNSHKDDNHSVQGHMPSANY